MKSVNKPKHVRTGAGEFAPALFMALPIAYMELVLRLMTASRNTAASWAVTALFSLCYGCAVGLVCTASKRARVNRAVTAAMLLLLAVVYAVAYFVYREFHVHYDPKTVLSGAADAAGGFTGDVVHMVCSPTGLLCLFLLFAPFLLYVLVVRRFDAAVVSAQTRWSVLIVALLGVCGAHLMLDSAPGMSALYGSEYSYQSAVQQFGLLTGLRLDAGRELGLTQRQSGFELSAAPQPTATPAEPTPAPTPAARPTETAAVSAASPSPSPTPEPTPTPYGLSELDIDFEALAESSSGTLAELDRYVASLTPSRKNAYTGLFEGKNLILITAEAFAAEVIDETLTPTLYRLATKGIQFTDYYQPATAGTTGGEYEILFGMLPTDGGASVKNTASHNNYLTIGSQLDRLGYFGWAFHNNDYTYYDRHRTHINLGYSQGFMGWGNGMEEYVESQWPESDLEMFEGTLPLYIDEQPFNIYYMTVSGHSLYSYGSNAMSRKHWDEVQELDYSDTVKAYIAANLELEDALTYLVGELESAGIADDTVIVLSADHFPYGLDGDGPLGSLPYLSELYGYDVTTMLERDHNRLIIWCGCLEDDDPIVVDTPTSSLDILPTLSNLFGTDWDSRLLPGRDVFSDAEPLVFTLNYDWKTTLGTYNAARGQFVPADETAELPEGYVDSIRTIVRNKILYCEGVLDTDYFAHVFGESE